MACSLTGICKGARLLRVGFASSTEGVLQVVSVVDGAFCVVVCGWPTIGNFTACLRCSIVCKGAWLHVAPCACGFTVGLHWAIVMLFRVRVSSCILSLCYYS